MSEPEGAETEADREAAQILASLMDHLRNQESKITGDSAQSSAHITDELLTQFMNDAISFDSSIADTTGNIFTNMRDAFLEIYANTSAVTHRILSTVYSHFSNIEGVYERRIQRITELLSEHPIQEAEGYEEHYERLLGDPVFRTFVRDTIYIYSLFGGNRTAEEAVECWERAGSAIEDGINFSTMAWLLHQIIYLPDRNPEIVRLDVAYNDFEWHQLRLSRGAMDKKASEETGEQANARIADQRQKQADLNVARPQLKALLKGERIDLTSHLPTQAPPGQLYKGDFPKLTPAETKKNIWAMATKPAEQGAFGTVKTFMGRVRGIASKPKLRTDSEIKKYFSEMKTLIEKHKKEIIEDAAKTAARNTASLVSPSFAAHGGAVVREVAIDPNISGLRRDRSNSVDPNPAPISIIRTTSSGLPREHVEEDPLSSLSGGKRKTKRRSQNKRRKSRKSRR